MDDSTHDEFVKAYLNYFEANERFLRKPSNYSKRDVRRHLRRIRELAQLRKQEVSKQYADHLDRWRQRNGHRLPWNKKSKLEKDPSIEQ